MKIHNKLFLILFSFSLVLVALLILLIQWSVGKGMIEYVNSKENQTLSSLIVVLEKEYQKSNSWESMQGRHKKFGDILTSKLDKSEFMMPPPPKSRKTPPHLTDSLSGSRIRHPSFQKHLSYALLDDKQNLVAGHYQAEEQYNKIAIIVNQQNVGWLASPKYNKITDGYELAFIEQQQSYLWLIALVTMMLVSVIALLLSRHLAEPIKLIISGMHQLTQGDYLQHIELKRKDELGELSRDFNELAITLHENEHARKRWLADISHELRTPLAILRGEIEAMLDGVRPLNKRNINSCGDEVKHLQDLVDDLQQLTSTDIGAMRYRKKLINFVEWLNSEAKKYHSYLQSAGISLEIEIEPGESEILLFSDTKRLYQLFNNLINNCIKYSQATQLIISMKTVKESVIISIEDNGVGVDEQHLSRLFEHLYRVENSRNRRTGGSGLGLSICAQIVAAHQGIITAKQSKLGGLAVVIELPLNK